MLSLSVRLRTLHGQRLYWLYRNVDAGQILYTDLHAPTGYGFSDRHLAEKNARAMEQEHNTTKVRHHD